MSFHDEVARYRAKQEAEVKTRAKRRVNMTLSPSSAGVLRGKENASAYVDALIQRDQRERLDATAVARDAFGDDLRDVLLRLRSYAQTSPLLWDDDAIRAELPVRFQRLTSRQLRAAVTLAARGDL